MVAAGGVKAESPAEAAREADLLFVLVFKAAQAETVLFGTEGAVTTLPPGATVATLAESAGPLLDNLFEFCPPGAKV